MISWLKARMRHYYSEHFMKFVLEKLRAGATAEAIKIDVTAGPMKTLLATSFARAGAAAGSRFSVLPLFRLLFW